MRFVYNDNFFVPRRFRDAVIDNKTNLIMAAIVEDFITNFHQYYKEGKAPCFLGPPGVGKTYASVAIAKQLHTKQVPVTWVDAVTTMSRLMDLRDFRKDEFFVERKKLTDNPVVVLDDFYQLQRYDRTRELFFQIVNARYNNNLPTVFTGTFDVETSASFVVEHKVWEVIGEKFGSSVSRRIKVMSEGLLYVGFGGL